MATGLTPNWQAAPPDVRSGGADEWAAMTGIPVGHPLVGGPGWGTDSTGFQADSGYSRTVTADPMPGGAPVGPARARWDDWRDLFNPQSPTPWIVMFLAAAVGVIFLRVDGRVGPIRAGASVGK